MVAWTKVNLSEGREECRASQCVPKVEWIILDMRGGGERSHKANAQIWGLNTWGK